MPGTSVSSAMVLPQGSIDKCTAATASLRKALLVCGVGYPCDLKCAASWNSAMRDARVIVDTPCPPLERLMNTHLVGELSGLQARSEGAFSSLDWSNLRAWCELDSVCGRDTDYSPLVNPCSDTEGQCRGDATTQGGCLQLGPTPSICPPDSFSFKRPPGQAVCTGGQCHSALTWLSLQEYQKEGLGCTGGLKSLGDVEYSTWACIHEKSCQKLDFFEDYACFKYSHVRGEFHFWNLNSALNLLPPLAQVDASFCNADGTSGLKDARSGQPVDLSSVTYLFSRVLTDGSLKVYRSGFAGDLGQGGCGTFKLAKRSKYRVEIDAGPSYYKWVGWIYTSTTDEMLIQVGLYPMINQDCSQVALTLSWCPETQSDLDLWLFRPGQDGEIRGDQAHAVYWAARSFNDSSAFQFSLELDDEGGRGAERTFGPESLFFVGDVPAGTYAVMVHAFSGNPSSTLAGSCPMVSLYSNTTTGVATSNSDDTATPILFRAVDLKGSEGNWWHVLNIIVEDIAGRNIKRFQYAVVDKMVPHTCANTDGSSR